MTRNRRLPAEQEQRQQIGLPLSINMQPEKKGFDGTGDTLSMDSLAFLEQCGQPWAPKPCNAAEVRSAIARVLHNAAEQISQHA